MIPRKIKKIFFSKKSSGVPSQNSRPHACMVCMVIPPKIGLEFLCVQILEYFDSKSITREIVRTPASNILISGQQF